MLSDPWRLQPAVPNIVGDDVSSDDDDGYYDDSGLADAYEIARKVREANDRLRADVTPLESSRQRRVQFRDPIRAVFFFTPDGEEENGPGEDEAHAYGRDDDANSADDGEEDEDTQRAEDSLARSGAIRRLVTAAAVERRSSLTSEDELSSAVVMTAPEGDDSDDEDDGDDIQQRMALENDSGDDVDSFESDDNASVSEDISELSLQEKGVDNQDASMQEVSGAVDVEDDRCSPDAASTVSTSSDSREQRLAQKRCNSRDSSLEEATVSIVQEERANIDLSAEGDDEIVEEAVITASGSANRTLSPDTTSEPPATSVDASTLQDGGKQLQVVISEPLEKEPPAPKIHVLVDRPSTNPATPTAVYGGSSRPKTVGTAGRTSVRTIRSASTPTRGRRGSSGSVFNGADQRTKSSSNRAMQQTSLQLSVPNARSVPSGKPTASSTESGKHQQPPTRCSTVRQGQRQPLLASGAHASCADRAKTDRNDAPTTVVRSTKSTYVLPRELKEELARKKLRERELQLQREAREESERRQRALEAEQAFRAWLAKKRREGSLTRTDNSVSRDEDSLRSESSRATESDGRRPSGAYEAWLRRKQRQQREEELRRRLRQLDVAATEKPRRSRQEAQQVYLAWLERKYDEERQRRLTTWAERRGAREAALSARFLRILEQYLRSEEFSRYPELVV
ncbi:uncharacterized protein LOC142784585 [Rhipicephalus microplus]|uniref:uncharacterized protein LOC142784585 n=1 Tax=Rhipicephalus microplus TaxID=6941 RepID=UPI003F6AEA32